MPLSLSRWWQRSQHHWLAVDAGMRGELLGVEIDAPRTGRPRVLRAVAAPAEQWQTEPLAQLLTSWAEDLPCVTVLPRGDYQLVQVTKPPVPDSEMERSVLWSAGSLVDFSVDQACCQVLDIPLPAQAGAPASEPLVYVVLAPNQHLAPIREAFGLAKHRLDAIDIRETAQRNLAVLFERDDECLCLLRFTQLGMQLTFTHRGELYLDRFIAQSTDTLLNAEAFERQHAIERLAQQLKLSIQMLDEQQPQLQVRRVLLAPTAVPLAIETELATQIGLPVEQAHLADVLDLDRVPELQAPAQQARFFVALGAALRGREG